MRVTRRQGLVRTFALISGPSSAGTLGPMEGPCELEEVGITVDASANAQVYFGLAVCNSGDETAENVASGTPLVASPVNAGFVPIRRYFSVYASLTRTWRAIVRPFIRLPAGPSWLGFDGFSSPVISIVNVTVSVVLGRVEYDFRSEDRLAAAIEAGTKRHVENAVECAIGRVRADLEDALRVSRGLPVSGSFSG